MTSAARSAMEAGEGGASGEASGIGGHALGGNTGTGCTGAFETAQTEGKHLCVAKMVPIDGPASGSSYQIDATEVTSGQYDAWLATDPPLPLDTDTTCAWKSSGSYSETAPGVTGTDPGHYPVANVDWCDARAYCADIGKRLCGAIGGGSGDYLGYTDATKSQWYRACSAGGAHRYPYGDVAQAGVCNDGKPPSSGTTRVGSLPDCTSSTDGYTGAYDMDGNVAEWEDSCSNGFCRIRGSAYAPYVSDENDASCLGSGADYANEAGPSLTGPTLGFRCCSL